MKPLAFALASALFLAASGRGEDQVENPQYASWYKFKPGTMIAVQDTQASKVRTIIIVREISLVSVDKDKLVLQTATWTSVNGNKTYTLPYRTDVPRLIPKSEDPSRGLPVGKSEGNVEEGTKTLTISGVEFKTKWYRNVDKFANKDYESQFWVSDEMPGKVVKSEVTDPGGGGAKVSMEVIEFKKK